MIMPTHIVAAAVDKVLDMITAPAIRERFQAYMNYDGNIQYLEYVTKPEFDLKVNRKI